MKNKLTILLLLISTFGYGQKRGVNFDPESNAKGTKPYEMASRQEDKTPFVLFNDCEKWIIETENCDANLYLTSEQRLYRETSGKLVYKTTNKQASVSLLYETPITINEPWDCIDFWTYAAHFPWEHPKPNPAFRHYAIIEGADGTMHELDFSQNGFGGLNYEYWFLSHIKMNQEIARPAKFIGIKLKGDNAIPGEVVNIFLGPIYIYNELLEDLTFKEFPEKLPFPLRKETILPVNKESVFKNRLQKDGTIYRLSYKGKDMKLEYSVNPAAGILNGIKLAPENGGYDLCKGAEVSFTSGEQAIWTVKNEVQRHDTLFVDFTATVNTQEYDFSCWYTINQKSLIVGIHEISEVGHVKEITLGKTGKLKNGKLVTLPFMPYNYSRHPKLLYADDLFFFKQFDWYYTDASVFTTDNSLADGWADYNKGVEYTPKTDGKRNPIREKLFINVSKDVLEVLPTIDNPASPMRSYQANRLWMIDGSPDYEANKKKVRKYRALGLENVTVRYHEGFWRDSGESYTFRKNTAPGRGGNYAVKEFVKEIKNQDWRVGLYSNYTDFAPVNKNWDPDWILRNADGTWNISWSRCYAPKPMVAWEQQAIYAPHIHKTFGSNHSYCDVHTAVSPMSRVDYDYRVPGAGTFRRTFECFGLLLLNEKEAYRGPVYSEGANHWWYAGLVDGNYGNFSPRINTIPILPEFQLYKIHPLEMDAGNLPVDGAEYLAYTLAYGHIGKLDGEISEMIKRYAFLQPLQEYYSMIPVKQISYFDNRNNEFDSSQSIKKGLNEKARLKIEYQNGFTVFINFSDSDWRINAMDKTFTLPHFGILAYTKDHKTYALSGQCDDFVSSDKNYRVDFAVSPEQYYFDTYGTTIKTENFEAQGKIFFKKEKFGWEIIPAEDFDSFSFNKELVGLKNLNAIIEGVNVEDLPIEDATVTYDGKLINMKHVNKSIFKYRVVPATNSIGNAGKSK